MESQNLDLTSYLDRSVQERRQRMAEQMAPEPQSSVAHASHPLGEPGPFTKRSGATGAMRELYGRIR